MKPPTPMPSNVCWTAEVLKALPVGKRLSLCPEFVQTAVKKAEKILDVRRVWILGSRARGDASLLSDYDLVFDVPDSKLAAWAIFVGEQRESAKTLLPIDWILRSQMSASMSESLQSEGILLYAKT